MRHRLVRLFTFCLSLALIGTAFGQVATDTQPNTNPKNLLLLYSYGHGGRGIRVFDNSLIDTLSAAGIATNNLYVEFLDLERNKDSPHYRQLLRDELQRKYTDHHVDFIVTVQQPALEFLLNEGKELAPDAPAITVQAPLPSDAQAGSRRLAGLVTKFDIKGTLERALDLFPNTRRVVFVSGSSAADRRMAAGAASITEAWGGKLEFEYTFDLSLEAMLKRVASLPPHSIVIFTQYNRDISGVITVAYEVEGMIVKAANAPVFGLYDFNLINGGIGGSVVSVSELGRKTAQILLDLWQNRLVLNAPVTPFDMPVIPMFDWIQIQRWGGDPDRLATNSVFVNRVPTFWQQYRNLAVGVTIFVLAQSLLILALVVSSRRKRVAELLTKASEENLALTLNSIGDAVIATDSAGCITRMNPVAERLCGWTLAEALGHPLPEVFRIVNANTREAVNNPVQMVVALGEVVGLANHTLLLAKGGEEFQIADSAAPIRDAAGNISGVVLVFSDVTDKYLAEQALRESQLFADKLLDSLPGIFYLYSYPEIQLVRWNKQHEILLGYGADEMKGRLATDWFSPEVKGAVAQAILGVMDKGSNSIEAPMVAKDGHLVPLFLTGVRLELQGQLFFVGIGIDITERKQAESALQKSEERWKFAIEGAGDGLWDWDMQTGNAFYSPRYKAMLGFTEEEIGNTADEWSKRIHPDDASGVYAALQPYIEGKPGNATVEFRMLCKDGSWMWVLGRGKVVQRDGDGKALRMIGTNSDITERKLAEAKLQLAASVFNHAREGIAITDAQINILDVNEAFTRITGYSRQEAIGQNPRILSSDRLDNGFNKSMWSDLTAQGHWSGEIWDHRKNGEVYAQLATISAVRDGQGDTQQYVALFSDITGIKEHQKQLEHMAHFDPLTHLPNRLLLADRLQQAMAQAQQRGKQLAVAYLDLDGFKGVNDRHGHAVGDDLLVQLATAMKDALREGDTLARLGGDEFVAVFIDLDGIESCVPMLTRILEAAASPVPLGDVVLHCSASIGVTFYPQVHDVEADQLLRQADQAMYQAKLAGKNRYHVFDAARDSSIRGHHESLERIRVALTRGELVLHYQPKVNMHSGKVIGAEALIRWQHPEKGLLAPATFLPTIEDHPLAVDVGEWVIDAAMTQIEMWHAIGLNLPVSVNIGARQLQQGDFVARLQAILAKHPQVSPTNLELEVLETSALADMEQVSQVIEDCHQIGVKFALDDFGTGYSSLTYLKRLRVALLKIDQSFVRDMLEDPDDLAILEGVIGLAAAFKREVIAEGVETVAHGTALLHLGCELAQGYGIARPMPAEQMSAWAAAWQPDAAWCAVPKSGKA